MELVERIDPMRDFLLALMLAITPSFALACGEPAGGEPCQADAMSIYLPNDEGRPAQNIALANFQYAYPGVAQGAPGLEHDELMRLHAAIKPLAAAAFGDSATAFEVMVRYTLSPDKPAKFDMQANSKDQADPRLLAFHASASKLTDFHSIVPTAYVVFHYRISPVNRAGAGKPASR